MIIADDDALNTTVSEVEAQMELDVTKNELEETKTDLAAAHMQIVKLRAHIENFPEEED